MSLTFKELAFESTPLGDISLRQRAEPRLDNLLIYEVKLDDDFLMSSLFTEAEIQLSKLALTTFKDKTNLDVVVGGLGLGYTAAAALESTALNTLTVIDVMQPVIDWHQNALVPLGENISKDPRCRLITADFFALATAEVEGFQVQGKLQKVDSILLDIDHSPSHYLNPQNEHFYSLEGLGSIKNKLNDEGVFGLWSNDPPESSFVALLDSVFTRSESHIVHFPNPYTGKDSQNTVYLAFN